MKGKTGMPLKIWMIVALLIFFAVPLRSDMFAEERAMEASLTSKPQAELEAGRGEMVKMRKEAELRKSVLDRPYVFVRSQTKYSGRLYQSCYLWHDRPLFASRALWEESESDHKYASFRKTFELYQSYGLDGFATFAWPAPGDYKRTMKVIYDTAGQMGLDPKKFHVMFEVGPDKDYIEINQEKLNAIVTNPYSFRIDGKSVISSYVIDSLTPEKLAEYIKALRARSGDKILFLPQMSFLNFKDETGRPVNLHYIHEAYRKNNGDLPVRLLNRMKDYLREYARVCDGLYIGHSASNPDTTFDEKFSDEFLCPLFKSVLAEPEFNGKKLFGIAAKVGYTSYHGAQAMSRDGTKTLRKFFELALKHRPDLVICPEWDELNEDTGFEPLLAKPMSSQRVIKYYMALFKGEKPTPNAGDDLRVPNLIISQKRQLMPGWNMDIELLNVPDTDQGKPYTVRLALLNVAGQVVYSSDELAFNTAELKDITLNLPSEKFKDCQALRSRLTINYGAKGRFSWLGDLFNCGGKKQVFLDGLPFTVLRATTCWDQTYFCTPLRNVLRPEKADVKFTAEKSEMAPGIRGISVSADLQAKENLAMVEVVQDSIEQFAWDPRNEYLQNDPDRQLIKLGWHYVNRDPPRNSIEFKVKLDDAPSAITFMNKASSALPTETVPTELAKGSAAFTEKMRYWNLAQYNGDADWWSRNRLISIKKSEMEKAVLTISGKRTSGKLNGKEFSLRLPLKDFCKYGVYSKVLEDGLMFSLETQYRPYSFPLPLGSGNAKFSARVVADSPNGVLAVRAVTEDGKVYWSAPFAVNANPSRETVPVNVYSDAAGKGIRLDIAKNRVPDIKYDFSLRRGNILGTDAGREFYGHVGGYCSTAIGFLGGEATCFSIPFYLYDKGIFKGADKPAPEWVETDDGGWALKFDGERGNFLVLPNIVIPQRTGFELSFELKPDEVKPSQVIFANQGVTFGGFILSVNKGKFEIEYIRRTPHDQSQPSYSSKNFKTNIPLYPGKWQKITLAYDESKVSLSADGQTESFDLAGIGLYLQNSHFGGRGDITKDGVVPFYKGLLRAVEVKHYVEK